MIHNQVFPWIDTIDDVLPHIDDDSDFINVEKDGDYTVLNYVRAGPDTFPPLPESADHPDWRRAATRRECRGLIFRTSTGEVLSRRFHKFFNVFEREETMPAKVSLSEPHDILMKLDGSMITPLHVEDGTRAGVMCWGTKMGVTDIAMMAELNAVTQGHTDFAWWCHTRNLTPIFEYTAPDNRIVLKYDEPKLTLLAVRHNNHGMYTERLNLVKYSTLFNLPLVDGVRVGGDIADLCGDVKHWEGAEGVVVQFYGGPMVKIKAEKYVHLHRVKDEIAHERKVVQLIVDQTIDDVIAQLPEEDAERLRTYVIRYNLDIKEVRHLVDHVLTMWHEQGKKHFALNATHLPDHIRMFVFKCWDNRGQIDQEIDKYIAGRLGSTKTFNEKIKPMLRNAEWEDKVKCE